MEDKELKEALGRMGKAILSIDRSVKTIERIQRTFLFFFILEFIISFIIGFIYGWFYM